MSQHLATATLDGHPVEIVAGFDRREIENIVDERQQRARRENAHVETAPRGTYHQRGGLIVAPIAHDDQRGAGVERLHKAIFEIVQRPAEVCIVVSAGHAPQHRLDGFIRVGAVEIFRDRFEMIDEGKGVCFAYLTLQGK